MSNIINKILERTVGFNLKRARIRKVKKINGDPIYVEFVGIPGVGKTTLYENVFKEVKSKWRNIHELHRIFMEHTNGIAAESLLCYQVLAESKMQSLGSRNFNGIDQMKLVKYFHSVLIADSLVHLFNKKYNIMSDEGLIHNFGEGLLALSISNSDEFKSLLKHRAVIYCHTSAEIIAKRIIEREKETGRLLPQHKLNSFEELVNLQKKSLDQKNQLIGFLSKYDIPFLSINTSNPMTENVDQVVNFFSELTKNKEHESKCFIGKQF